MPPNWCIESGLPFGQDLAVPPERGVHAASALKSKASRHFMRLVPLDVEAG